MLISELTDGKGNTRVAVRIEGDARLVNGADSVYALALEAIRARESLRREVATLAVTTASKLLEREIDARTHADLISKLATQI